MKNSTNVLVAGLLMTTFFASCSRPVAYFQKSSREHFAPTTTVAQVTPAPAAVDATEATAVAEAPVTAQQVAQANAAVDQLEASVNKNTTLASDKKVQKRLSRVRTMMAAATAKASIAAPTDVKSTRKANLMERLMMKKMNKKINKQLAPQNPEKAMLSVGTLSAGAVLVLIGLLLLLLTTGSAATIGLVLLIVGAILLLVGLL
jgi:hypothetical protein